MLSDVGEEELSTGRTLDEGKKDDDIETLLDEMSLPLYPREITPKKRRLMSAYHQPTMRLEMQQF